MALYMYIYLMGHFSQTVVYIYIYIYDVEEFHG